MFELQYSFKVPGCSGLGVWGSRALLYMGGCQNYGPFLVTLNNRCRTIIGTQKGTLILTTTQMGFGA